MSPDRFDRLEDPGENNPEEVQTAIPNFSRFEHLEIGEIRTAYVAQTAVVVSDSRVLCSHCGQPNEPERDVCWACFKPLRAAQPDQPANDSVQEFQLVLDGHTYSSLDHDLPKDIAVLIDRIRKEGYSPELLAEWRNWRATRNVQSPSQSVFASGAPPANVDAFKGSRGSVIRIDGKVYQSDDKNLPSEIQQLFSYLNTNGVTPELLQHLRQFGDRVKFRPNTTAVPSDGDISFWNQVQTTVGQSNSTTPNSSALGGSVLTNLFTLLSRTFSKR